MTQSIFFIFNILCDVTLSQRVLLNKNFLAQVERVTSAKNDEITRLDTTEQEFERWTKVTLKPTTIRPSTAVIITVLQ